MAKTVASPKTEGEIDPKMQALVEYWLNQCNDAYQREKAWRREGGDCVKMYEGDCEMSYNVLYSNTEVLMPALYSATPKPAVMRRLKTKPDPIASVASDMLNKALGYTMDSNDEEESEFDQLISATVLDAAVAGRGQAWFTYDAKFREVDKDDLEELEERDNPADDPDKTKTIQKVDDEYVCPDSIPWDQFLHGFGRTWARVPWVARVHKWTKTDIDARWPDKANLIDFESEQESLSGEKRDQLDNKMEDLAGAPAVTTVYQIWDKTTRKVYWICCGLKNEPLEEPLEDPLKLSGFFPCPEPLHFVRRMNKLTPKTLYSFYKAQAKELEEISKRISALIRAMRVRGMYNALIDDIAKMLDSEENKMLPITNAAALEKGLAAAVFMVPIQDYVPVIQELWLQREQIKKVIAEITGISDIIRGSTVASETATAQDIKNRWGTLRLQDMQKRVQRFTRDCIRIMAEIMANHFDKEKFQAMTGVKLMTQAEKAQIQEAMQQQQAAQATMAQGQPTEPPQIPPEIQEALQQPTWEEVIGFLRDKVMRQYRIDIETDSTLADDVKQDKAELAEIMQSVTQLVQALTPAVQGGFLSFDVAKEFLLGFVRRFRLGAEVEQALAHAVQPPPQDDKQAQMEMQIKQQEAEQKKREGELKLQQEQMKFENEQALAQMEMELKREEHRMKMEEMQLKHSIDVQKLQMQGAQMAQKAQLQERQMQQQAVLGAQQHEQAMQAGEQQGQLAQQSADVQRQSLQDKAAYQKQAQKQKMQEAKQKPKSKGE